MDCHPRNSVLLYRTWLGGFVLAIENCAGTGFCPCGWGDKHPRDLRRERMLMNPSDCPRCGLDYCTTDESHPDGKLKPGEMHELCARQC